MDASIESEFGRLRVTTHPQARHVKFRYVRGEIVVTVPPTFTQAKLRLLLTEQRQEVARCIARLKKQDKIPRQNFAVGASVPIAGDYTVEIITHSEATIHAYLQRNERRYIVAIPSQADVASESIQTEIKACVVTLLRHLAAKYLPQRTAALATHWGVKYSSVNIGHGKQRLGTCNSRGEIQLSYYLLSLPAHLIDYVILHELAHLSHLNHGEAFHALCNRYCGGNEGSYEKELKAVMRIAWFR